MRGAGTGELGRKDGYDRKSLPRRNWLYKIGSAPGSYTCLLRMQTSSLNARKPPRTNPSVSQSQRGPFALIHDRALDSRRDILSRLSVRPRRCPRTPRRPSSLVPERTPSHPPPKRNWKIPASFTKLVLIHSPSRDILIAIGRSRRLWRL